MQSKTIFNIIAVVIIIAVLFFGYRLIFKPSPGELDPNTPALVPAGYTNEASQATDEFLGILLSLQRLDLLEGSTFFANPAFGTLIDFSTPLQMKVPGKANPFEPVLRPAQNLVFDPGRVATGTPDRVGDSSPEAGAPLFPGGN